MTKGHKQGPNKQTLPKGKAATDTKENSRLTDQEQNKSRSQAATRPETTQAAPKAGTPFDRYA